jgi:exodeoxyribonuclease-3
VYLFREKNPAGGEYSLYDYRVKDAVERGMGWRIDYILTRPALATRCTASYVDLEPRRKEKPSDHTFLVAEFLN